MTAGTRALLEDDSQDPDTGLCGGHAYSLIDAFILVEEKQN
jgi:hypothetical protein